MTDTRRRRTGRAEDRMRRLTRLATQGVILNWSVVRDDAANWVYRIQVRADHPSRVYNRWEVDAFLAGSAAQWERDQKGQA